MLVLNLHVQRAAAVFLPVPILLGAPAASVELAKPEVMQKVRRALIRSRRERKADALTSATPKKAMTCATILGVASVQV